MPHFHRSMKFLRLIANSSPKLRTFCQQKLHTSSRLKMPSEEKLLSSLDPIQIALLNEQCILLDNNDNKIGSASKKDCHLLENINKGMLHRAFSVFLFNSNGELLVQQRSDAKITYPGHFTNTCCSHPLNFAEELDETEAIGVRRAAQRKLNHELGIKADQVPLDDFKYLTRIHYKAPNVPNDEVFGEHEIDYILFLQKNVDLAVNDNEVKSVQYLNKEGLQKFIAESEASGRMITPWFKLITEKFLYTWWDNLTELDSQTDLNTIHRL